MATTLADAYVLLRPDLRRFGPELKSQTERAGSNAGTNAGHHFGSSMSKAIKAAAIGLAVGGAFVGAKAFQFLKGAVKDASDLNETVSKSQNIFPKTQAQIEAFAATSATALGMSRQAALEGAASFGNFFNQIGIAEPVAARMSTKLLQLSADLGSFNNADPSEVMNAFLSATRGEYDALQRFVPTVNAARIAEEAMRATRKKSVKELTDADKAMALYTIAFRDAGKAQGDFARTSEGAANQSRIMAAKLANLKAEIGTALLPVLVTFYAQVNGRIIPALEELWAVHGPKVIAWLSSAALKIGPLVDRIMAMDWRSFGADAGEAFGKLGPGLSEFGKAAGPQLWDGLKVGAEVLGFLADHADLLAKALPFLVAGFLLFKTAQAASNIVATASIPLRIAEVAASWGMRGALRAHTAALVENTAVSRVATGSSVANTAAENAGIVARGRAVAAIVAHRVATIASATWMGVATAAQWLWNIATYAFPLVWIVAAILIVIGIIVLIATKTTWFQSLWRVVWTFVKDIALKVAHWFAGPFVDFWKRAWNFIKDLVVGFVTFYVTKINQVVDFFKALPGRIMAALGNLKNLLVNAGRDIVIGLWNGIQSLAGFLADKVRGFIAANVPGPVQRLLGIASPSKLFEGFGRQTVEGYIRGWQSAVGGLSRLGGGFGGGRFTMAPAAAGAAGPMQVTVLADFGRGVRDVVRGEIVNNPDLIATANTHGQVANSRRGVAR